MALNWNSPIVQNAMTNAPQAFQGSQFYMGSQPTFTAGTATMQSPSPYPSPRDMVLNVGQSQMYGYPQQFVGGYTPPTVQFTGALNPNAMQQAFDGYANPYIGYGEYTGYGVPYMQSQAVYLNPTDQAVWSEAAYNDITVEQQLEMESRIWKQISKIVNHGASEQEIEEKAKRYDIVSPTQPANKTIEDPLYYKPFLTQSVMKNGFKITITTSDGKETQLSSLKSKIGYSAIDYRENIRRLDESMIRKEYQQYALDQLHAQMHDTAVERQFDDCSSLVEFFNEYAWILSAQLDQMKLNEQAIAGIVKVYQPEVFKRRVRLRENMTEVQRQKNDAAIDRILKRYDSNPFDAMTAAFGATSPNGTGVTATPSGHIEISTPQFIQDRMAPIRERFYNSINNPPVRGEGYKFNG